MAHVETLVDTRPAARLNVADRLAQIARQIPGLTAVACPLRWSPAYRSVQQGNSGGVYATVTFAELDGDATRIARGLAAWGVPPGTRLALLVRPGIEFVTLVFALLRAGMVIVLVDPGMGRQKLIRCLADAEPEGFVAAGAAQAARLILRHKFPRARWNVTVGHRWLWGGVTLETLRTRGDRAAAAATLPTADPTIQLVGSAHPTRATTCGDDPAAIIFTSGSTGPSKGVLYTHRMFDAQVAEIQSMYNIEPGGIDLACFPLFALFNSTMGVTTVLPEMDFSRPATANPDKLLTAANDWRVTQAFASPAAWRALGDHCAKTGERIDSLRQVFSCGAPVPADLLQATIDCVGKDAKMHTPYGATECLPVSTIEAAEVLGETAARTNDGAGVCVGRKFDSIAWRVIRITDELLATIDEAEELPVGEIGELIVRGPQVSPRYVTRQNANAISKIGGSRADYEVRSTPSNDEFAIRNPQSAIGAWHRTGDVGYFDDQGRFWYCGRKSQRVETADGPLCTECVEAIFIRHAAVRRCALVGIGPRGRQVPALVVEREPRYAHNSLIHDLLQFAQSHAGTCAIRHILAHPSLPVDLRHNSKINREFLANWAARRLGRLPSPAPEP